MTNSVKDLFSSHSDIYAKYRPLYPAELYEFLIGRVRAKETALDCGTGNGQAAAILADHFKQVHATDISEAQIGNAVQKPNLRYHVCKAEQLPFPDNYFDLITAATAVHWFRFEQFFAEIQRVGKDNSIFACWAYSVFHTNEPSVNRLVDKFYSETVHAYWDAERRHVDEEYKNIPMPFAEVQNPGFVTRVCWDLARLEGYLNTWSAVQHYINKHGVNPVTKLVDEIKVQKPPRGQFLVTFPIFMRIGVIKK